MKRNGTEYFEEKKKLKKKQKKNLHQLLAQRDIFLDFLKYILLFFFLL